MNSLFHNPFYTGIYHFSSKTNSTCSFAQLLCILTGTVTLHTNGLTDASPAQTYTLNRPADTLTSQTYTLNRPADTLTSQTYTSNCPADTLTSQTYILNKEDVIFIPAEQAFEMTAHGSAVILVIAFNPCFLLEYLGFDFEHITCNSSGDPRFARYSLISHMAALTEAWYTPTYKHKNYLLSMAHALLNYMEVHFLSDEKYLQHMGDSMNNKPVLTKISNHVSDKSTHLINDIHRFMAANYADAISLSDIAAHFDYTPPYMSNIFKKYFGMTFQDYLTGLRLKASELYLTYTQHSPVKIAALCGFPNLSALNAALKKAHQMSADAFIDLYRKTDWGKFQGNFSAITNPTQILDYLSNYLHIHTPQMQMQSDALSNMITINAKHHSPLNLNWDHMINLGTAADFEKPDFRHHVAQMQSELSFKYGRFTGLFFLAKSYYLKSEKVYDFSRLFQITDFLKSIHLRPMIELTNKPFHIYNENELLVNDYETFLNPAIYDSMLLDILPHFLKASIGRYGIDEVSQWQFELWLRYNPAMTSIEPFAGYLERYQKIAQIIKTLLPQAKIGGPGFNTFMDTDEIRPMLDLWNNMPYKPDFFTAYYFPYMPENPDRDTVPRGFKLATTPERMPMKMKEIRHLLNTYPHLNVPLCVTEYSAYLSESNYINDSIYPALYILYQTLANRLTVDYCSYWLASDLSLEYKNPSAPFFGGSGIISKHGIAKPSYFTFTFLKQLGSRLIEQGENYIVTLSENGCYLILAYDIASLSPDLTDNVQNEPNHYYTYSSFENTKPVDLTFTLQNVRPGSYTLKEMHLNQNHGNALNIWRQFNYMLNLKSEDIRYIKYQSLPLITCRSIHIASEYTADIVLNNNQIVMHILTPAY